MGNSGQHLRSLGYLFMNPFSHLMEGLANPSNFKGARGFEGTDIAALSEFLYGIGEVFKGAHLVAHKKGGDDNKEEGNADD